MGKMRPREEILKEMEAVKKEAARTARFGSAPQMALQAGINAPLMATALGSLLEVALDIRDLARKLPSVLDALESIENRACEHTRLLGLLYKASCRSQLTPEEVEELQRLAEELTGEAGENVPVIEPGNEVDAEHLAKIFPPCPECGSERVNGEITDETGRKRKCEACGHEWELEEVERKPEPRDCPACGAKGGLKFMLETGSFLCFGCQYTEAVKPLAESIQREVDAKLGKELGIDKILEEEGA